MAARSSETGAFQREQSARSSEISGNPGNSSKVDVDWKGLLVELSVTAVSYGLLYLGIKHFTGGMDPMSGEKKTAVVARDALSERLTRSGRQRIATNEYEDIIAQDMVDPDDIDVTMDGIGGLDNQKQHVYEIAILPLQRPDLFNGGLLSVPKGLLLYGVPGTGKTMLAKAVANESGAAFIDLKMSTVMNKWFGESQKLIRAVFSLAQKLAPTIIFIDEIDAFMRARGSDQGGDGSALGNMKAVRMPHQTAALLSFSQRMLQEFMALWDGLMSEKLGPEEDAPPFGVLVMGATNRPYDVVRCFI